MTEYMEGVVRLRLMANNLGQSPYRAQRGPWPGHRDVKR